MPFIKVPNFDIMLNALWVKQVSRNGSKLIARVLQPQFEPVNGGFRGEDHEFDYGDEDLSKAAFSSIVQQLGRTGGNTGKTELDLYPKKDM
jgi:hypothetical protein